MKMFTQCHVYLRIFNPSFLIWSQDGATLGFDYAHNNSSDICYRFLDSEQPPSALEQGNVGSVALCVIGNKGDLSQNGTPCGNGRLDPFDLVDTPSPGYNMYAKTNLRYYYSRKDEN